jgi:DNA-binding MarR family transcriptional regulator
MFHAAVGAKQGLSSVEEKALDVLLREGPLTHAELGAQTALAAPSVTDLIDRLVRKGYVRRERHPDDGRRVLVHAEAEKIFAEVAPLFTDWVTQLHALYETYTDEQLATIADFMSKAAVLQRAAAERLASSD